ncbi:MAG: hypothetical protein ACJ8AD_15480, partial [Gemmatimonadaceae bacterium]
MRTATRLLVPSLLLLYAVPATLAAQTQATSAPARAAAGPPLSVRWNRLVPMLVDESADRRRAARRVATAAGDSAALRRIAQTPQPFLFRVYTLLSVAQYAAVKTARDSGALSADAAVASASAAVLSEQFTDSAVRATIARELARDLEQARAGARNPEAAMAGTRLGDDVARRVIAWAPPVGNFAAPWNGTIPTGPGMWYSA